MTIFLDSDNLISLTELRSLSTGAYITDATVTATLKDADGVAVSGASGMVLSYVVGSNATYHGFIPVAAAATLTLGDTYYLELTATSGKVTMRKLALTAQYQGAS